MTPPKTKPALALDAKLGQRILSEIKEEEIVAMSCDVINIPSPTGHELQMAEYMRTALSALGLNVGVMAFSSQLILIA